MELLVLNTDFESIAVIDTYESMIWTDRYNSYGDFEIFFAMDTQLLQYLKEDYYLWLKDSEHCMIIEDIKINADTEEGNHLIVTGRSLESILERRIIWGQRIFNGNLQNGIQTMLNECIISPSIADRKISNFVFVPSTDPKITRLKIDKRKAAENKQNNLETQMLIGLAHDRIIYLGMVYIERGYITQDEYENLYEYLYKPYEKLGGNGSAKRIMTEVDQLAIHKSTYNA